MIILVLCLFCLIGGKAWAATNDFIGTCLTAALCEWNTATNWSLGHVPDSTEDTTFTGIVAPVVPLSITTTTAVAKNVDFSTAGAVFILSGSPNMNIYGSLTCKTGMTWSETGVLFIAREAAGTLTTNGVSLASAISIRAGWNGGNLTLADALTCSILYVYGSATLNTGVGNNAINCTTFSDLGQAGTVTLTLGSSIINCTNVSFAAATLTVNHTGIVNLTTVAAGLTTAWGYSAGTGWGTVNYLATPTAAAVYANQMSSGAAFVGFNISYAADRRDGSFTFNNAFTIAASSTWKGGGVGYDNPSIRPLISSSAIGTSRTITVSAGGQTLTFTDVDFRDIVVAATNSPTITGTRVGDCGGNTNVDTDAPKSVYLGGVAGATNWYDYTAATKGWSATEEANYAARQATVDINQFPLPQDTAIIDDKTFSGTPRTITVNAPRIGTITATAALTSAETLALGTANYYGDLLLTGTNLAVTSTGAALTLDARVATLDLNCATAVGSGAFTVDSYGGIIELLTNNLTHTGTFTLTRGTFDLNGKTLSTGTFSSSSSNTRTLTDGAGGGGITVTNGTGTIFNMATDTNLTVSGAPDITGPSAQTADVTIALPGANAKTFGDLTITAHTGDFDTIITGVTGNTVGALTLGTCDATHWSDIQFTAGTTLNMTSLAAAGCANHTTNIKSVTSAAHTLSDTSGTNTVSNCTIAYSTASGGAAWVPGSGCINGGNNTGWSWGGGHIMMMK